MYVELIESPAIDVAHMWEGGGVPSEFAIHGIHSATLSEKAYEPTQRCLPKTMGFHLAGHEHNRFRYAPANSQSTGAGHLIDVVSANAAPQGRVAVGTIHHIAFRTPDDVQQLEWLSEIGELGYNISPVMDRVYFHSIYYRSAAASSSKLPQTRRALLSMSQWKGSVKGSSFLRGLKHRGHKSKPRCHAYIRTRRWSPNDCRRIRFHPSLRCSSGA